MIRYILFLCLMLVSIACSGGIKPEDPDIPDIPSGNGSGETKDKTIQMWVDAHANFTRLATKASITSYLQKLKNTGFNEVYIDVKPGIGYALYNSEILPKLTKWGDLKVERDWDYLDFWIEEGEKFGIKVIASISTFGFGYTKGKEGLVYDSNKWDGKTQVAMVNHNPNNLEDIRNRSDVDAAFLNPVLPEVQTFVLSIIEEIVIKYPKLKGFCFDYCRWYNNGEGRWYGFEDATIKQFEIWSGVKVNSLNEIVTATGGVGPLFSRWVEFRSMTITNFITHVRSRIKILNPDIELHLWASAHWASRYSVAQNWASKKYVPKGDHYTATYHKTGFADQLDVFSLGAYTEAVWIKDNPGSEWSVENFVKTYNNYTMGDCKVYGSIAAYAYRSNYTAVSDAVYLCLKETDGLSVFELGHVDNFDQWNAIKQGIDRVVKK